MLGAPMSEPELVVENREHLWALLVEAAQVEHLIMCQYLYASFSLKTDPAAVSYTHLRAHET